MMILIGNQVTINSRLSNNGLRVQLITCHAKDWNEFLAKDKEQTSKKDAAEHEKDDVYETENLGVPIFNLRTQETEPLAYGMMLDY